MAPAPAFSRGRDRPLGRPAADPAHPSPLPGRRRRGRRRSGGRRPWSSAAGRRRTGPRARPAAAAPAPFPTAGHGILVLVTLYGGNDGLNTVIPTADSTYASARPDLGYRPDQVLTLADGLALNPQLKGLKSLWDAGRLGIVRGVGYPRPSLSHFQSMAIWQTADPVGGSGPGWLGRWLDGTGTDPMRAVSVGTTLPPALRGQQMAAACITRPTITLPGRPAWQSAYRALNGPGPDRSGLAGDGGGGGRRPAPGAGRSRRVGRSRPVAARTGHARQPAGAGRRPGGSRPTSRSWRR